MQASSGNAYGIFQGMLQICIETGIHGLIILVGKDILFFVPERENRNCHFLED
jgi:hypothetical protein